MDALAHLLTTNTVPNPLEVSCVQKAIKAKLEAIQRLQLELENCRAILSPLRGFPAEVLGEVFGAVLDTVKDPGGVSHQLVQLSLVCRAWRNAALATPRLWNRLGVNLVRKSTCIGKVRYWLSRAGSVPCTLALNPTTQRSRQGDPVHHKGDCPLLTPGLVELLAKGPALHQLSINCTSAKCFRWLSGRIHSLRAMERQGWDSIHTFELHTTMSGTISMSAPHIFPYIPRSTSSLWLGVPYYDDEDFRNQEHARMRPVLAKLTSLTVTMDWPKVLEMTFLPLCISLQVLNVELESSEDHVGNFDAGAIVVLPELHTLCITGEAGLTSDHPILRTLRTPCLVNLDVQLCDIDYVYDTDDHYDLADNLSSFVVQSRCAGTLRRLRLQSLNITPDGLDAISLRFDFLTHLILDFVRVDTSLLDVASAYDKTIFPPRLEVLEWYHVWEQTRFDHVSEHVATHCRNLKKFTMQLQREAVEPDKNIDIMVMKDAGVEVKVWPGWG